MNTTGGKGLHNKTKNPKFWTGKAGRSQCKSRSSHSCRFSHWKGLLEIFRLRLPLRITSAAQNCLFPASSTSNLTKPVTTSQRTRWLFRNKWENPQLWGIFSIFWQPQIQNLTCTWMFFFFNRFYFKFHLFIFASYNTAITQIMCFYQVHFCKEHRFCFAAWNLKAFF